MDRVFESDGLGGGYTKQTNELEKHIREILKETIRKEIESGTSIEVIEYVLHSAVHTETLMQRLLVRTGKDIDGN